MRGREEGPTLLNSACMLHACCIHAACMQKYVHACLHACSTICMHAETDCMHANLFACMHACMKMDLHACTAELYTCRETLLTHCLFTDIVIHVHL